MIPYERAGHDTSIFHILKLFHPGSKDIDKVKFFIKVGHNSRPNSLGTMSWYQGLIMRRFYVENVYIPLGSKDITQVNVFKKWVEVQRQKY